MTPDSLRTSLCRAAVLVLALGALSVRGIAQNYDQFVKAFDSAKEVNDRKRMIRALKDDTHSAIDHFRLLVDSYATRGDGQIGDRIELFKELWKEGFESDLLQNIERYRAALDNSTRQALLELDRNARKAHGLFVQGQERNESETIMNAAKAMFEIGQRCEDLGDKVLAYRRFLDGASYLGNIKPTTKEIAVMQRDAMRRYVTLHEELDWTGDLHYKRNVTWLKELERTIERGVVGAGEGEKGAQQSPGEDGPAKFLEGSKWEQYDMLISLQSKPQPGICPPSDLNPLNWVGVYLDRETPTKVGFFQDGEIWMKRTGANEFRYGPNEAEAAKWELDIGSKPEQSYLKYVKNGYEVEYGFFSYLPTDRESANQVELNYKPEWGVRKSAVLFFRSASILHAEIAGEKFEFFDENANGIVGEAWNAIPGTGDYRFGTGWEQPIGVPMFDSMKRAGVRKRLPFSTYVQVGEHWHRLRVTGNNETLRYRALDPESIPTGKLLVHWKGPRQAQPEYLVVAEVGFYKGAAFDVWAEGTKKPIEVPAGKYSFIYGRIQNGKAPRNNDALILPGKSQVFDVDPGKTTEITIGAPFQIEFEVERQGDDVIVDAATFYVQDSFGLRYGAIGAEVLEPELIVSKKNDAKNGRPIASWRAVAGAEISPLIKNVNERRSAKGVRGGIPNYHLSFWPINAEDARNADSLIRVRLPFSGPSYVGVRQRKHKLFGELEHIWK